MNVQPIRDQIVGSKESTSEKSSGGIIIQHVEEKNVVGKVLAVGKGHRTLTEAIVPLEVQVGDRVLFNKNVATEVKDGDVSVFVIREEAVICVLK
jgi:chaperonin GroES